MLTQENSVQKYIDIHQGNVSPRLKKIRLASSVLDMENLPIWRGTFVEIISTALLVFGITMSAAFDPDVNKKIPAASVERLSLIGGLLVATLVWIFGDISGAQMNPAVTFAFLFARRTSVLRFGLYFVAQMVGAFIGAGLTKALVYDTATKTLGVTLVNAEITSFQAFCMEFIMTMILMLTVMATSDAERPDLGGSRPLSVGLAVVMNSLIFIPYTGASMNPVRSFAPAAITGLFDNHWVYWLGPIGGACLAVVFYDHIVYKYATPQRFLSYMRDAEYLPEGVHATVVTATNDRKIVLQTIRDHEMSINNNNNNNNL